MAARSEMGHLPWQVDGRDWQLAGQGTLLVAVSQHLQKNFVNPVAQRVSPR
ncbi:MAG: hypothetical protein H6Q86_3173 [candidate division NC10 bacterium]|nr:hypothetical protein [candidate division NC10 bacterium]